MAAHQAPCPWDSPGKNTGVGCHFLLQCCCQVTSVVSDSVRPHRPQPTRLPRPWDSPGKNTGVGCHFLFQCMKVKSESEVAQSIRPSATPWTAAHQAPPSMGFSRQDYWSGVPSPSPEPVTYPTVTKIQIMKSLVSPHPFRKLKKFKIMNYKLWTKETHRDYQINTGIQCYVSSPIWTSLTSLWFHN